MQLQISSHLRCAWALLLPLLVIELQSRYIFSFHFLLFPDPIIIPVLGVCCLTALLFTFAIISCTCDAHGFPLLPLLGSNYCLDVAFFSFLPFRGSFPSICLLCIGFILACILLIHITDRLQCAWYSAVDYASSYNTG